MQTKVQEYREYGGNGVEKKLQAMIQQWVTENQEYKHTEGVMREWKTGECHQ